MRYKNFEFEFYNRQSCKKQTRHSYRIFHEIVGSDVVALVSQQKSGISTRTATKNMLSAVFPMIVLRELGWLTGFEPVRADPQSAVLTFTL